jgi:8-amino-7-oxononanoate synthase
MAKPGPDHKLRKALAERARAGNLRRLSSSGGGIDFCSNDYLGMARSNRLRTRIDRIRAKHPLAPLGATGSRLISGNSEAAERLEARLAAYHRAEAGLLFGSGYAANSGLLACIAGPGDTLIMDELIHASSIDGARLSRARKLVFRHNDLDDLAARLDMANGATFISVESLYSMGGDTAPLPEMATLATEYGAGLVVDEAHSNGITGPAGAGSVVENGLEDHVFARIHTFGKGLGLHGAVVLGSKTLREYLLNFCRPFVFTTAPSRESLDRIEAAYELLPELDAEREQLFSLVHHMRNNIRESSFQWLDSRSWVQSVIIPGNDQVLAIAGRLGELGFDVKAIRAPSVAAGSECIRICLHAFNTVDEIDRLMAALESLQCVDMSLRA